MRSFLAMAFVALAACTYDPSGTLAPGEDPVDPPMTEDDNVSNGEGPDASVPDDPPPPDDDPPPPDDDPPDACSLREDGEGPDCNDPDCPACGSLSVCCSDGTCAGLGLCL